MPTTVTNTIGTGGDYTTLALWEADCPANLVTSDEIWRGELLDQEFSGSANMLTIAGQTVDSTRYVELTAQAGASFADNANKLTNALRYNASNGAAITQSSSYATTVLVSSDYTRISRLQIGATGGNQSHALETTNAIVDQCLVQSNDRPITMGSSGLGIAKITNSLAILNSSRNSMGIFTLSGAVAVLNCTIVRPSNFSPSNAVANAAVRTQYATTTIKNVAGFNFWHFSTSAGFGVTGNNNASDQTISFGTGNQASLTYADQFEEPSNASSVMDFRTKAGADLIANGADLSGDGITVDIVGTTRTAPYDISAWQVSSASNDATITGTVPVTASLSATMALAAVISGTVPVTGSATAAMALAAQIAGLVPVTGQITATFPNGATITGLVPVTGEITATFPNTAIITGTVPVTAQITASTGQQDTHDGFARRSRREKRIAAAQARTQAERLADAQALRLALDAALGVVAEVPTSAMPVAVAKAVDAAPKPAEVDWRKVAEEPAEYVRLAARVQRLVAAVQSAADRQRELAEDDEEVAFVLGMI